MLTKQYYVRQWPRTGKITLKLTMKTAGLTASFLVVSMPLFAQFDNLVTNDDGSVLYFSSSLKMRGTQQVGHRKLFVADGQGVRLHTQRESGRGEPYLGFEVSNWYSLHAAVLNGDGSIVGLVAGRDCHLGSSCMLVPKLQTELAGREYRGVMDLSRNGRFALLGRDGTLGRRSTLVDLESGDEVKLRGGIDYSVWRFGRRRVTSGGTTPSSSA